MTGRLILASNRLPVEGVRTRDGTRWRASPGGLARALTNALLDRDGVWIGWAGLPGHHDVEAGLHASGQTLPFPVRAVPLSEEEERLYYRGFANEVVWPLFHDLHPYCHFEPAYWEAYRAVNERFADAVADEAGHDDHVWVHDYHLMGVAEAARARGVGAPMGFFLHIPFPTPDVLQRFPWHRRLVRSLLHYDRIGFQTGHDAANFLDCIRTILPDARVASGDGGLWLLEAMGHTVEVGAFPIGIDAHDIERRARSPAVEAPLARWRSHLDDDHVYVLGVERLDYTKGIPERLEGFRLALERHPELRGRVTLLQHVDPSRQDVSHYAELRRTIEHEVGRIDGEFGTLEWTPVRYSFRHLEHDQILALYRLARVALVTPVRDGMNLVAKEFCAAHADGDGVLVLSEFTGAAHQLSCGALLVNPHDVEGVADAIHRACTMGQGERRRRMARMRDVVRREDVGHWMRSFLAGWMPGEARLQATEDAEQAEAGLALAV